MTTATPRPWRVTITCPHEVVGHIGDAFPCCTAPAPSVIASLVLAEGRKYRKPWMSSAARREQLRALVMAAFALGQSPTLVELTERMGYAPSSREMVRAMLGGMEREGLVLVEFQPVRATATPAGLARAKVHKP